MPKDPEIRAKEIHEEKLKPILELPFYHQLTYIYFLASRMLPNYETFSSTEKWGNPKILLVHYKLLRHWIPVFFCLKHSVQYPIKTAKLLHLWQVYRSMHCKCISKSLTIWITTQKITIHLFLSTL